MSQVTEPRGFWWRGSVSTLAQRRRLTRLDPFIGAREQSLRAEEANKLRAWDKVGRIPPECLSGTEQFLFQCILYS